MALLAHALKVVQFASTAALTDWSALRAAPLWAWLVCAVVVAFGQHLNYRVYALLGIDGVYYGSRLGKAVPWVTSYPYSAFRDPQYVGCIATLLGVAPFVRGELVAWWLANYLYLIALEAHVPQSVDLGGKRAA